MKGLVASVILFSILFILSCATDKHRTIEKTSMLPIADVSEGLPRDGLWRQNISLIDLNNDGFLDIIAPPPRKAGKGEKIPYIFLWDNNDRKWRKGSFKFPELKDYGYGGITTSDLNKDGFIDIVLAVHMGRVIVLQNDKGNGFVEKLFPVKDSFHSRIVEISDINNDGWPDIIAFSEGFIARDYKPIGILIGINKNGNNWDVKTVNESADLFGDSMAVGDINGDNNKDIIVASLIGKKEGKKLIWFGDGRGNFNKYDNEFIGDMLPFFTKLGDVDGDMEDEVFLKLSGIGSDAEVKLSVFKWTTEGFIDISSGLELAKNPIVFDVADMDGDGKNELFVLLQQRISIYKYSDKRWIELGYYPLTPSNTIGAHDLRVAKNRDGSLLIVYNLGSEKSETNKGIKAYILK
ncbi:MAG: VCBS repeat-containing protein [Nitrospirota bacterium]